jgi:preprotein translocase subunit SecE
MKKIINFFKEVKKEIGKVKWPEKKEMVKYSMTTIVFILFFSIMFAIIDLIMAALQAWVK